MTTRKRQILVITFAIVALAVLLFGLAHVFFPLHRDPPKVIGVEPGPGGHPARRIVYARSYRVTGWLPDPEGGHPTRVTHSQFFLEAAGVRHELKFLTQALPESVIITDLCRPVRDTSLWVSAGYFRPGSQIDVVVFDPAGIRAQRTLPVAPDARHPGHDFWFENGNATLKFLSTDGVGTYDVAGDKLGP